MNTNKEMTYGEWIALYLDAYRRYGIRDTSFRQLELIRDLINPALLSKPLCDLMPFELQRFINQFCTEASESYANKMYSLIRSSLNRAFENHLTYDNLSSNLSFPHRHKQPHVWLSTDEAICILSFAERFPSHPAAEKMNPRTRIFISVAVSTLIFLGLRRGELLGLKYSDLDIEHYILHIRRGVRVDKRGHAYVVDGEAKNEISIADLAISDEIGKWLLSIPRCGDFIFSTNIGTIYNPRNFNRLYDKFISAFLEEHPKLTKRITPHVSRHTTATLMLKSGVDVRIVQRQLRHASIKTTMRYTHPDLEDLQIAQTRYREYLKKSSLDRV